MKQFKLPAACVPKLNRTVINFACVNDDYQTPTDRLSPSMSIRLYIGNLPQTFEEKELAALLKGIGEGIRFKSVLDRDTGSCRGFGFANVDDPKVADAVIEQLNGKDFGGSTLRVERSERRESGGNNRRGGAPAPMGAGQPQVARKTVNKVVHSDAPGEGAPDPRWAGELSKLKDLLGNQKTAV